MSVVAASVLASTMLAACGGSESGSGTSSIKVGYSQEVADVLPLWIGVDAGIFKKHGLNVSLQGLSGGSQIFPALVSDQIQLAAVGGSEMLAAAASGAKVKYLATITPVFPYELYSKLKSTSDLKGKKFGITSASGSLYIATLAGLKQIGLSESDVHIVPLGSVENVNNALLSGSVDAAMTHPPTTTQLDAAGLHSLVNLTKIPNANIGMAAQTSYISENKDTVQKFMDALLEAIQKEKSDKSYSISELKKHLGVTDQKALEDTYDFYAKNVLPAVPIPKANQFTASQQALAGEVRGVGEVDLSSLIDPSFVQKAAGK